MATVAMSPVTVQDILGERPTLAWERIPLAAALCTLEYTDGARAVILDKLAFEGKTLRDLTPYLVEPEDLPALEAAVEEGRTKWMVAYRERGGFLPLPPICGGSPEADETTDRSVPPAAAIMPPELELLDELLDGLVVWDEEPGPDAIPEPEACRCGRRGTCDGDCPADAIDDSTPDERWTDPRTLPPISGGCDPRDEEPAGPTDAELEEMYADSRVYPEIRYGYE